MPLAEAIFVLNTNVKTHPLLSAIWLDCIEDSQRL